MCGLFVVIDFAKQLGEQELRLMGRVGEQLAPRGPDASGLWQSPCKRLAMGHRRLAIVDLSPTGQQPMHDASGRYTIVFNGEIYNYRELRATLSAHYEFRTESDTEIIMAAWARWGSDCLPRLRGMFAFVLWDSELRTLHTARDPFG
ncbi:MAG: asparagine synthetase B family protein, partial [Burkholderiaceae bacterium]